MPMNGFSLGRDCRIDIVGQNGILVPSKITGFDSKPQYNQIKIKGLDGVVSNLFMPDGWEGTFDVERTNSIVDDYFASLESIYYGGGNIVSASITETISEADGSVTQYRYTNVALRLEDAGKRTGDQTIKMMIGFAASRRLKVL